MNVYFETMKIDIQYFQPKGEGYTPTNRIITLDKISNQLRFDDIDD
ncbi:hypothetical protein [Empedobacter sp.]|nr:hypothetical protein [Empedobacter sp.]